MESSDKYYAIKSNKIIIIITTYVTYFTVFYQDVIRTVASGKRRKRRDLSEYNPNFQEFIYQNAETEEDSSMTEIVKSVMETKF